MGRGEREDKKCMGSNTTSRGKKNENTKASLLHLFASIQSVFVPCHETLTGLFFPRGRGTNPTAGKSEEEGEGGGEGRT